MLNALLKFNLCIHMFIYWPGPVFLSSTMTVTHKLSGYGFCIKCYFDFDLWPSDLICVWFIYWPCSIFLPSRMTVTHKLFKILSGHSFCIKCYCDLDLWLQNLKGASTDHDQSSYQEEWLTHKLVKILSGHGFCIKCYCDLDLWPSDLNIYRDHLLSITNLPTKYNDWNS